jgi:hypothetical protein
MQIRMVPHHFGMLDPDPLKSGKLNPNLDPHQIEKQDPDPHQCEKQNLYPLQCEKQDPCIRKSVVWSYYPIG